MSFKALKWTPGWLSPVGVVVARILALIGAVAIMVPFEPRMPTPGLDGSWVMALNQALAQHLSFGDRLFFTFGPWASIYTQAYHPATYRLMLLGGFYLALSLWAALLTLIDRRTWPWMIVLLAIVIPLRSARDAVLFLPPLAAAIAAIRIGRDDGDSDPQPLRRLALVAVWFAPLGFLPLVKGSVLILSLGIAACACGLFLARRRAWLALTVVVAPAVSALVFWLAAGQSTAALVVYLSRMLRSSSAYADAMSVDGNVADIRYYLASAAAMLITIAMAGTLNRLTKLYLTGVYGVLLFIGFKAGFVRHDGHALMGCSTLLFGGLMLPFTGRPATFVPATCLAFVAWAAITGGYYPGSPAWLQWLEDGTASLYSSAAPALMARVRGDAPLRPQYDAALALIARQSPLPALAGSTDIYPHHQAVLFASPNTWSPRPVFQTYAAYTPELLDANRQHLLDAEAPDNIVFRLDPIDGRLPPADEGPSWPTLLRRYQPVWGNHDFLFLRRRQTFASAVDPAAPQHSRHRLGESVPAPSSNRLLLASIDVRPTIVGHVVGFLFKRSHLRIAIDLADGTHREFRLVPGNAAAGFVMSPLVENHREFARLYGADAEVMRGKHVKSFVVTSAGDSVDWSATYDVTFREITVGDAPDVGSTSTFDKVVDEVRGYAMDPAPHCEGTIDRVNESSVGAGVVVWKSLRVDGWVAASIERRRLADTIYVVLSDGQNRHFAKTRMVLRSDVAAFFRTPELDRTGFAADIDVSGLRGEYTLGLAITVGNRLLLCPQPSVAANIQ
jgi:hypothetical protein